MATTTHPSRMNLRRSPSPPTRRSRSRDRRDHHPRYGGPAYGGGGADFLERYEKIK